jgi:hypothetical protein
MIVAQNLLDMDVSKVPMEQGKHIAKDKDGTILHYYNGHLHNPDGPAVLHPDGSKEYWLNGKMYRSMQDIKNTLNYQNRKNISQDNALEQAQPKYRKDGTIVWKIDGLISRNNGPAIEYADGREEFWLDGRK